MATAIRRAWQKGQSGSCAALVRCGSCSNLHTTHKFPHRACQRHCSQAISRAAATPSAKKTKIQAKPAQKSDRTASKARSRVVLASISPVHGSAARLLLSTLTDEFAFRRILRIDVRALPIQIEHHWQVAAGTTPLPCADYIAVTKVQD